MHKFIDEIKKFESEPYVVESFLDEEEIKLFQNLYKELPVEINNTRQKIIKKKWSVEFRKELQKKYTNKLKEVIGDYEMDNPETKEGAKSLGLFQESYMPVTLHVDTGFDFNKKIYKQTLIPLTPVGSTVIFKNRYYGKSTNFTIDEKELGKKDLKYGQNIRSNDHIGMFGNKSFDKEIHKKFLTHEKIENLVGLEVELIYNWEVGSLLIFDRTHLHCSSSVIDGKKIGLTTFTKR